MQVKRKLVMIKTDSIYKYVAKEGEVEDWACYYGKITDSDDYVMRWGDKINETRARYLFPEFKHLCWRP